MYNARGQLFEGLALPSHIPPILSNLAKGTCYGLHPLRNVVMELRRKNLSSKAPALWNIIF